MHHLYYGRIVYRLHSCLRGELLDLAIPSYYGTKIVPHISSNAIFLMCPTTTGITISYFMTYYDNPTETLLFSRGNIHHFSRRLLVRPSCRLAIPFRYDSEINRSIFRRIPRYIKCCEISNIQIRQTYIEQFTSKGSLHDSKNGDAWI